MENAWESRLMSLQERGLGMDTAKRERKRRALPGSRGNLPGKLARFMQETPQRDDGDGRLSLRTVDFVRKNAVGAASSRDE
jgi:hypothetical protein